jgi:hypothetical protein
MTQWRVVAFIMSSRIGWTEGKQQVSPLRFHGSPGEVAPVPQRAGAGGMTISFRFDDPGDKSIKSQPLGMGSGEAFPGFGPDPRELKTGPLGLNWAFWGGQNGSTRAMGGRW